MLHDLANDDYENANDALKRAAEDREGRGRMSEKPAPQQKTTDDEQKTQLLLRTRDLQLRAVVLWLTAKHDYIFSCCDNYCAAILRIPSLSAIHCSC